MAFCAELHWKRAGLTEEKLFIILLLTVVFTELLVNRLVRRCQCSGAHLVRIQAGIWKMNGADCTNLLPFFFFAVEKGCKSEHCSLFGRLGCHVSHKPCCSVSGTRQGLVRQLSGEI